MACEPESRVPCDLAPSGDRSAHAHGHIELFSLGGTITHGSSGTLRPASLIKMSRWLPDRIPVRGTQLALPEAPDRIRKALDQPHCLGVVVALGLGDIESLSHRLGSLTTPNTGCVVLTGAATPPRSQGTDAPGNIADALRVVCDETARALGVLIVVQGRIFAGSEIRYAPDHRGHALHAEPLGPIGMVTARGVEIVRRPIDGNQLAGTH